MRASSMIDQVRNNTRRYEKSFTSVQAKLAAYQTEDLQLQQQLAQTLREFATVQLNAGRSLSHIIQREANLRQEEEATTRADLSVVEAAIGAALQERKLAADAVQQQQKAAHERITADPRYAKAKAGLEAAMQKASSFTAQRTLISDEAARKLPAFQQDKFHQYLKDRGFGTGAYAPANRLMLRLDRWLAATTSFSQNAASEDMLNAMLTVCQRGQEDSERLVNERKAEVESVERIHIAQTELAQATSQLRSLDDTITSRKAKAKELKSRLEAYASKTDSRYANLQNLMQQDLGGRTIEELTHLALQTPDNTDDRVVAAIATLQRGRKDLAAKIAQTEAEAVEARSAVQRAKRVERDLRDSDFDNDSKYSYRSSLDLGSLLTGYMAGKLTNGDVTSSISRYQDEIEQPTYSTSSSSSSSWGSSSGTSESFSTNSSSGGGSFSTTDSF